MPDLNIVQLLPGQTFFPLEGEEKPEVAQTSVSGDGRKFHLDLTGFAIAEGGPDIPSDDRKIGYHFGVVLKQLNFFDSSRLFLDIQGFVKLSPNVTAVFTVLIGERVYQRKFCNITADDYLWRVTYSADSFLDKLRLPIVLMPSVSIQENQSGYGLFTCDDIDGGLETPPTKDDMKDASERPGRKEKTF